MPTTPFWRIGLSYATLALVGVVFLAMAAIWLLLPRGWRLRRAMAAVIWRMLLRGFGMRVAVHGQPLPVAGTLFVSNHISWIDIAVIGRVLDAAFVAKGEIRGWPIIGKLTQAYGCLFVEREKRGKAADQAAQLASHLEAERGIVLFPEGTTGLGTSVLPFRSSLFALIPGVAEGTARVQPVTLRYRRRDGSALSPEEQRMVGWIGDDELLPNALGLLRMGGLLAEVWFEEPVSGENRKALARACEAAVLARISQA
jgi:1-acyl-sn-glycerol-3-phosphate acyltransferase